MLRKLLKHELLAVGRILLPVYGILLLLSGLFRLSSMIGTDLAAIGIVNVLLLVLYILFSIAVLVISIVVLVRRYYNSLYGDQGYLTHTLPATPLAHLVTKLISALLFFFAGTAVGILSWLIAAGDLFQEVDMSDLVVFWRQIQIEAQLPSDTQLLALALLNIICFILTVYAAISLGQLWNRHRVGGAVLAFFIIEAIRSNCDNVIDLCFGTGLYVKFVLTLVLAVLCFLACYWQLSRKLNLQ